MLLTEEKIKKLRELGLRFPIVNANCIGCSACCIIASSVFEMSDLGQACVTDLDKYDENLVNEAINVCPSNCISWGK